MRAGAIWLGAFLSLSCGNKPSSDAVPAGSAASPAPPASSAAPAPSPSAPAPAASPRAQGSASAAPSDSSAPPAASARGLPAPGNDAEAVALIKRILKTCKWERGDWAGRCEPLEQWGEWNMLGLHTDQRTVFALCEDSDLRVRQLCSAGLQTSVSGVNDPKVATAILDAFEKERDPIACKGMARAVAHIRVEKAGSEDRIKQLARGYPIAGCRATLVESLLSSNGQLYDFISDLAKTDKEPDVREAAASALRPDEREKPERAQRTCKLWSDMLAERDQPFTGKIAWLLIQSRACADQWDATLQGVEALVTAGKVRPPLGGLACNLHEQKKASPAQKTQALETAKKLVDSDKSPLSERLSALRCVARFDPDGKAFAARFADSPVAALKTEAARLKDAGPAASGSAQAPGAAASGSARAASSAPSP